MRRAAFLRGLPLSATLAATLAASLGFTAAPALAEPVTPDHTRSEQRWWALVSELADDRHEGREAGTPGYDRAAAKVVEQLRKLGLKPAGTQGYYQPIDLIAQHIDPAASSALLSGPAGDTALRIPDDLILRGAHTMPARLDAPLVFAGYGLSMPDIGHDDFAGIDVAGKIVVVIGGGPADLPGSRKANARSERARLLAQRGALGLLALTTPAQIEIPWKRQVSLSARPSLMLADAALREVPAPFLAGSISPTAAAALFAGSPHSFAELAALADASQPLPRFTLAARLNARLSPSHTPRRSANIAARLPGRDRRLAREHVVLSAHLDGLGIGEAADGDAIYNGAFDNAVGVANVVEIARTLAKGRQRPRRSILFFVPTAEEAGLLGSRYFAARPTVPRAGLVADINFDMPLPIFPLRSITPIGYEESTLGDAAQAVSARTGLPIVPDPFPDRNVFIRSDQYSFVRAGVPSLFMKFGFARGTPEADLERAWRANIYHSPRDDTRQPVLPAEALRFNDWVTALLRHVADAPQRPRWHAQSYFRRFSSEP